MTTRIGAVIVAFAALFTLASVPAQADDQSLVDQMIAANPGARQIDADTVRLANGVEATAVPAAASCRNGYLCIFDAHNFSVSARRWDFVHCGFVNIGASGWSDRIRSYLNYQSRGTVSIFMNWTGSSWEEVERSTARHEKPYVDGAYNADGIWVC